MKLYLDFFAMHLKSQMQYPATFFMNLFARIVLSFATVAGVLFMLMRFSEVEGFTLNQVLLCSAVVTMAFSFAEVFARGFDIFPRLLGNGEFDRCLVRPRGVIFQVLASHMEFARLGIFIHAVLVLCYAIPNSGVVWTWDKILTFLLMIVCGAVVFFGLYLVYASVSFFTVEGLEFMNILTHGGREFGRYPFSVYGDGVLRFLTYVVPLALFQYYPLLYLIGREESPLYMLAPLPGVLFLLPCYGFWRFGLRRYKSTGS
ncbi:MAG: ABC-2 family transporter protein [Oscillospiraceae bacterium]|nr:ABC-2 family transporter protein [Oscillospiraceae bacterium]